VFSDTLCICHLCSIFVCVMVVIGISWIPVIQGMQGAQLYFYIQAISAYLAPPIAAVYLLAVLWPRANERVNHTNSSICSCCSSIVVVVISAYLAPPIAAVCLLAVHCATYQLCEMISRLSLNKLMLKQRLIRCCLVLKFIGLQNSFSTIF